MYGTCTAVWTDPWSQMPRVRDARKWSLVPTAGRALINGPLGFTRPFSQAPGTPHGSLALRTSIMGHVILAMRPLTRTLTDTSRLTHGRLELIRVTSMTETTGLKGARSFPPDIGTDISRRSWPAIVPLMLPPSGVTSIMAMTRGITC